MRADTVYVQTRDTRRLRLAIELIGTQAELARATGIKPSQVNQMLRGAVTTVPITVAVAIEDHLCVPRGSLFAMAHPELAVHYLGTAA